MHTIQSLMKKANKYKSTNQLENMMPQVQKASAIEKSSECPYLEEKV